MRSFDVKGSRDPEVENHWFRTVMSVCLSLCVLVSYLPVCMSVGGVRSLELELQTVVSCRVVAGN